jgi:hypothetical protein
MQATRGDTDAQTIVTKTISVANKDICNIYHKDIVHEGRVHANSIHERVQNRCTLHIKVQKR